MDAHVAGPDPVSGAVRAEGAVVERCSDVYEGLSRLGRAGSAPFDAVVLCLDYLTAKEYEFIDLAKRCASEVPVFVHGGVGSMGDVGRALALGANEWLDGSVAGFRAALVGDFDSRATGVESRERAQAERNVASTHPSADSDERSLELTGDSGVSDDDTAVRVPWSRGSDVPVRLPPGAKTQADISESVARESAGAVGKSEEPVGDRDDWLGTDDEPLLSEGELAALAGGSGFEIDEGSTE